MPILTERGQTTVEELSKSQALRLYDVFVLAPYLFWIGTQLQPPHCVIMKITAAGVLLYNGRNWLINEGII